MRINNIQNTPNFGMALKIDVDAKGLLKEQFSKKEMRKLEEIIKQQESIRPNMYLTTGNYAPRNLFDFLFKGTDGYEYLRIRVRNRVYKDNGVFSTPMLQIKRALKYIEKYNKKHPTQGLSK